MGCGAVKKGKDPYAEFDWNEMPYQYQQAWTILGYNQYVWLFVSLGLLGIHPPGALSHRRPGKPSHLFIGSGPSGGEI